MLTAEKKKTARRCFVLVNLIDSKRTDLHHLVIKPDLFTCMVVLLVNYALLYEASLTYRVSRRARHGKP